MKNSVKNVALALVVMLAIIPCFQGCAVKSEAGAPELTLYEQGLNVISLMDEMAHTREYVELYGGSEDIKKVIAEIGEGDYSEPSTVYSITVDSDKMIELLAPGGLDGMSEMLKSAIEHRASASLIPQINGMEGAAGLAASSICVVEKLFVNTELSQDTIYLYVYDNALPVAVVFTLGEDGAVSANGSFIIYKGFVCGSAEEVKSNFGDFDIKVERIEPAA